MHLRAAFYARESTAGSCIAFRSPSKQAEEAGARCARGQVVAFPPRTCCRGTVELAFHQIQVTGVEGGRAVRPSNAIRSSIAEREFAEQSIRERQRAVLSEDF